MKNSQEMWAGPVRCNDKKLRQLIRENSIVRKLRTGEYYLSPGNPIYYVAYVASGVTSHYMFSANGREKVLYRLGTGWFFSEGIFYNENGSTLIPDLSPPCSCATHICLYIYEKVFH